MKRILIFGNSGSGKTTLATQLAYEHHIPHLDLDSVSWASPGIRKAFEDSLSEIRSFIQENDSWVIEGCYGFLLAEVAVECAEMHFLNPGIDACLENNLQRPWESHKYESKAAQDKNLQMLQDWVREYETRQDEYSLQQHRAIFDNFKGVKQEHT